MWYREEFNRIVGPILEYTGFSLVNGCLTSTYVNPNTGLVESSAIKYKGKFVYVCEDGFDYFNLRDNSKLLVFNPFVNREHLSLLTIPVMNKADSEYRDEDDAPTDRVIDLMNRLPRRTDGLPSSFKGSICEVWCRGDKTEVLGFGADDNDIYATMKCIYDFLFKTTRYCPNNLVGNRLTMAITKMEKRKKDEVTYQRQNAVKTASSINYNIDNSIDDAPVETKVDDNNTPQSIPGGYIDNVPESLWDSYIEY